MFRTICKHSMFPSWPFQLSLALEAIDMCSEAHQRDPRNTNVLRDRAEAYILNQDYEKGERAPLIGHLSQKTPLHSPLHASLSLFCLS